MGFNYWSRMAENEQPDNKQLQSPEETVEVLPEVQDSNSDASDLTETDIVSLDDVRHEKDDATMRQIEDILKDDPDEIARNSADSDGEVQYKGTKAGFVCRVIFLDIPLGIPLLIVCLAVISALIAGFGAIALAFAAVFVFGLSGSLFLLAYGFINLAARLPLGLTGIGSGMIFAALAIVGLVLALLIGIKLIPIVGACYGKIYDRLGVFKRRTMN